MAYPIMAPSNTWYKTSVLRSTITEINIVDSYIPTGNETETWNADVDNSGAIKCYLNGTVLTIAGNGSGKIALNEDSSYLFHSGISDASNVFLNCTAINGLELFDASNASDISRAFAYCIALKELDLSSWDVSNVTSLRYTFASHESVGPMSLETLNLSGWNITNKCTLIRTTFQNCANLTELDVSNWDTSGCTDMSYAFYNCASLSTITVSNWRTSACTNMQNMFAKCTALTELDVSNWDVSKVTNFNSMFSMNDYGANPPPITILDVSNWDVSSATDMGWMFYGLANLRALDLSKWDVSKVESFHHCFAWCTSLVITGLENWDVSSAKTLNGMFHNVRNTTYDVSKWDVSNVESFGQMFEQNPYVTNIYGLENWNTSTGKAFYSMFSGCPKLKELNLSSFDTRNANENWIDPQRNAPGGGMYDMFGRSSDSEYQYYVNHDMKKITFGKNFSFNGDGTCTAAILPAPLIIYIDDADGNWYDSSGVAHSINDIPNRTAATYYASKAVIDEPVLVEYGTMYKIANQIRKILETSELYTPSNMVTGLQELWYQIKNLFDITKLTGEAIGVNGEDYSRFLDIQDDVITITTSMYDMGAVLMKGQTLERGTYNISFEARNNKTSEEFSNNKLYITLSDGNGNRKEVIKYDLAVYQEWATIQCNMTTDFDNAMLSIVPEGGKNYPNPNFSFRNIRIVKQ